MTLAYGRKFKFGKKYETYKKERELDLGEFDTGQKTGSILNDFDDFEEDIKDEYKDKQK